MLESGGEKHRALPARRFVYQPIIFKFDSTNIAHAWQETTDKGLYLLIKSTSKTFMHFICPFALDTMIWKSQDNHSLHSKVQINEAILFLIKQKNYESFKFYWKDFTSSMKYSDLKNLTFLFEKSLSFKIHLIYDAKYIRLQRRTRTCSPGSKSTVHYPFYTILII